MQPRHTDVLERDETSTEKRTTRTRDKTREKSKEKNVEFVLKQPNARGVCLAGSFNNWDQKQNPMQKAADGWKVTLPLPPGRYEYRFVVDGQWISDPNAKESTRNDFGSTNSVLVV